MSEQEQPVVDPVDRRRYKRLERSYEIDFSIVRLPEDVLGLEGQKGVTRDVSQGGLCLDTTAVDYTIFKYLHDQNVFLDLRIQVPGESAPIKIIGKAAWFQELTDGRHRIGISFRSLNKKDARRLLMLPSARRGSTPGLAVVIGLGALLVLLWMWTARAENQAISPRCELSHSVEALR